MSATVEVRAGTSPPPDFQQAQKPVEGSQFLQIVAKRTKRREHKLTRVAFRVSRLMEFCTEKELVNQTGHHVEGRQAIPRVSRPSYPGLGGMYRTQLIENKKEKQKRFLKHSFFSLRTVVSETPSLSV